jgi:hypothetical protein
MAMSRVTLRMATAAAATGAMALALAGCGSVGTTQSGGPTGSVPVSPATTAAAPTITLGSGAPNTAPGATGAANPADAAPACTGDQIHQSNRSDGAATGHAGVVLLFTNTSGSTCTLTGYPGAAVSYSNGSHSDAARVMEGYLGGAAGYSAPPIVTLAAAATASAILMWTDVADPNATCQASNYTELLTTTPNTQSTVTYQGGYSCENLQVTPVVPGSSGSTAQ